MVSQNPVVRKSDAVYHIEDFECGSVVLSVTYLHHGQMTKGHSHDNVEAYYVAQGQGEMELGSSKRRMVTGDFVYIDSGVFHRVRNTGNVTLTLVCCWNKGDMK
jgi:mannose-6-phosphate isomerase-like protein (cupin superfamily)